MAFVTKLAEYVIILKVAGDNVENVHMTLAFCVKKKPEFKKLDHDAIRFNLKGFCAKIIGEDFLGPDHDIPVWVIGREFLSKEQNKFLNTIYATHNVEQSHTKGLKEQYLHITKNGSAVNFKIGDTISFSEFCAKQVGSKHEPYFRVNLL